MKKSDILFCHKGSLSNESGLCTDSSPYPLSFFKKKSVFYACSLKLGIALLLMPKAHTLKTESRKTTAAL